MTSKILVCDEDKSYIEALGAYFISLNVDMEITLYSSMGAYVLDEKNYDLGMLSWDFLRKSDDDHLKRIETVICLADSIEEKSEDYDTLYKFQQMSAFKELIMSVSGKKKRVIAQNESKWIGITSPCHHELTGLFSMAYAKRKAMGNGVLFLDLENNSIMPKLLQNEQAKTVTDYLYLLEGSGKENDELSKCFSYYDDIAYISAAKYYGEIASLNAEVWEELFESIDKQSFDEVVVLFDDSMRGMSYLIPRLKKVIVLSREGDYYRKFDERFLDYISKDGYELKPQRVMLPLSAKNLNDGSYVIDQLMSGNLAKYALRAG